MPPWVADYIGLPYLPGGRDRAGLDCWGLVTLVWTEAIGHDLPPYQGLPWGAGASAADVGEAATAFARRFRQIDPGEERLGDGILLRMRGVPMHIGLVVRAGQMLHIADEANSCLEDYRTSVWARRVLGFYRYG